MSNHEYSKMKRFEERTVVITGASRGIGKGIAKRFADEGANLVLAANEASVDAVAEEFRSSGANAVSHVCDVTNKSDVERLYDHALAKFRPDRRLDSERWCDHDRAD